MPDVKHVHTLPPSSEFSPSELLAMCNHEGTLPIDVLVAVCEKAGAADAFDELRA